METRKETLIQKLNLKAHPEGGFFTETYRSGDIIPQNALPPHFAADRNISTGIYYLLGGTDISRFHRIKSDEMWHHYEGGGLTIHIIHEDGLYEAKYLGKNIERDEQFQLTVPANAWFGCTVNDPKGFVLAGCTVAPGFDFEDFEMADRHQMLQAFPDHEDIIKKLT